MARVFTGQSMSMQDTSAVSEMGKILVNTHKERMDKKDFYSTEDGKVTESFINSYQEELNALNTASEDLTFGNNGGLYTDIVADFVERRVRPTLVGEGIIKRIRVDSKGTSAIKVPVSNLQTASALPDTGNVTYAGDNYGAVTIQLGWVYAANKITMELIEQSNIDIIQDQLFELGDAISRKVDTDIIAAIDAAITVGNTAGTHNGTDFGAGNNITYTRFLNAVAKGMENNAEMDSIVTNPGTWVNLMTDSDVRAALGFNSVQAGTVFPQVQNFFGMKLLVTPQVSAETLYLVDSKKTGYYVESSGVKVFNGRPAGTLSEEVIAAKLYGVAVVQPMTVYRVRENQ